MSYAGGMDSQLFGNGVRLFLSDWSWLTQPEKDMICDLLTQRVAEDSRAHEVDWSWW